MIRAEILHGQFITFKEKKMKRLFVWITVFMLAIGQVGCGKEWKPSEDLGTGISFNGMALALELAHIAALENNTYTPQEALKVSREIRTYIASTPNITGAQLMSVLAIKLQGAKGAAIMSVVKRYADITILDMSVPLPTEQLAAVIDILDGMDMTSNAYLLSG
jgi:hypothetical protein